MKLTIGHIYPDLLNLYGDRGNIQSFVKRLEWRGIEAEVISFLTEDEIDFSKVDLVLLGGGSEREQETACTMLRKYSSDFKAFIEDNGVVLAVCGGFEMLGKYYFNKAGKVEGLNVLDITSDWQEEKKIGNISLECPLSTVPVYGFENHVCKIDIGSYTPFAKIMHGHGNADDGNEGLIYKNVIATSVSGPLLPKNPQISDYLLERALSRKYKEEVHLDPLPDELEKFTNEQVAPLFTKKVLLSRM